MATRDGEHSHSIQLDLKNLAATIALASDALAAAAQALAEAASAIGDATNTFQDSTLLKISSGITHPVDTPQRLGDRDEPEIGNRLLGAGPDPADQLDLNGDQSQSRVEHGMPNKFSSDSGSQVEVVPLDPPPGHQSPGDAGLPEPHDTPGPELNNKLDILPPSPVEPTSRVDIVINQPVGDEASSDSQPIVSRLRNAMKPYPAMPLGRNYIRLEHEPDGFAFINYMALQVHIIVCLISEQLMNTYSELLRSLTGVSIHRVHSLDQFRSLLVGSEDILKTNLCQVMLVPPSSMYFLSVSRIMPDCIIHWGRPSDCHHWVNQTLAFIKPTVRVCIILVGKESFDGVPHGVVPYPNRIVSSLHDPSSPFQLLRQLCSRPSPRLSSPTPVEPRGLNQSLNPELVKPSKATSSSILDGRVVTETMSSFPVTPLPENNMLMTTGLRLKEPRLFQAMKSHPMIPPGRNYIHLDNHSDALAFIAYMSLQARVIVCVVPSQRQDACAKLLKSITYANVHVINTPKQYDDLSLTPGALDAPSYDIFLTPYNASGSSYTARWIQQSNPDCILHWSHPASAYFYTTRRLVSSLSRDIRACVLVVGENTFDGGAHGVEPYPSSVLKRCFQSDSPFQLLKQISSQLLPTLPVAQIAQPLAKTTKKIPNPRPLEPSSSRATTIPIHASGTTVLLPAGHHYIVLDQASDINIMSMTAYIALNSKKVICHIPGDKDLSTYHRLMNLIANIDIMAPVVLKGKPFEKTLKDFKLQDRGLWMRSISSEWNSFWSKSLVNCVIYWGIPSDLAYYSKECKSKVDTSYLILTSSQAASIQSQLNAKRGIKQHPHIQASDFTRPGSLLCDLREKLVPLL